MSATALFIAFSTLLFTCVQAGQFLENTVPTADGDRTFWIYLPQDLPAAQTPVVFVFHGDGGSAQGIASATGFNASADANNFIVVYPQAAKVGDSV